MVYNLEDFELSEIESIECIGDHDTIDITVEGTHCFYANDIYTHNSGFSSEVNDINSIGKAIEVFQKADQVITFSEPIHLKEKKQCIALLLKNRLGQKEIPLLVNYDPGKVIFAEVEVLNMAVLMSKEVRKTLNETIKKQRDKLNLDK